MEQITRADLQAMKELPIHIPQLVQYIRTSVQARALAGYQTFLYRFSKNDPLYESLCLALRDVFPDCKIRWEDGILIDWS